MGQQLSSSSDDDAGRQLTEDLTRVYTALRQIDSCIVASDEDGCMIEITDDSARSGHRVHRRYEDFATLRAQLCSLHRGIELPPLPMGPVLTTPDNGEQAVAETWRAPAEAFLDALVPTHNSLCSVHNFLELDVVLEPCALRMRSIWVQPISMT